ncbi:hypothetical protein HMPREF1565_1182 [Providencia alcalifaciens RIMD 1656011]|uniref:Uncharacterized protein n=2 Tax=Providencia alcalifaciens TaxID=126385 RepID=B6XBW2_9GAMM|nr:hypothetical protein PROVALCAL_00822 [Providencia alcalifaciens DSM 30120]ETT03758.1 hypothetical protein HMPREF1562_3561 [Providencia alcalifaciens F90-2004]EUC96183.1 hypothetical protein HMPREF1567_3598 [Providencia alcalifaciens PAL-2]EUD03783.1 hypothetical protein HMPREF1565_1182 [Providencia alcalifaciens RIMD 1656011]EUD08723.1 hypothetical protein HMPREF1564_3609 [Providencia alcalifaciens R90-1475]EUD12100.1 hypothetical protein HMPREF1563_1224 [Providencia alcalifaciens 205/92]
MFGSLSVTCKWLVSDSDYDTDFSQIAHAFYAEFLFFIQDRKQAKN